MIAEMAPPEELDDLMRSLSLWCKDGRGRQKALAEEMGVSEQLVSNWLAGRKKPSLDKYLQLRAFLKTKEQRRRKSGTTDK